MRSYALAYLAEVAVVQFCNLRRCPSASEEEGTKNSEPARPGAARKCDMTSVRSGGLQTGWWWHVDGQRQGPTVERHCCLRRRCGKLKTGILGPKGSPCQGRQRP
jgi:hypothetical protein